MHYRQRAPASDPVEIEELEDVDTTVEIIAKCGDEYLCDEEDIEWQRLPPTHRLIPLFQKERKRILEGMSDGTVEIPYSQLREFMSSVFEEI